MNNNFTSRIIIGLFFVLLGLGIFLDQIGLNFFGFNVFNLWPLVIIFFGILALSRRKFIGGLFLLLLGSAFLFSSFFNFSIFAVIWPFLIIFIGVSILFKPNKNHFGDRRDWVDSSVSNKDSINDSVMFWGSDQIIKSQNFKGGKLDCVFGGFKLDLSDAEISKEGAYLEINSVFGGGEVIVGKNVRVDLETSSFMGGVSNTAQPGSSEDPTLKIKASAVFGGIEVKN